MNDSVSIVSDSLAWYVASIAFWLVDVRSG